MQSTKDGTKPLILDTLSIRRVANGWIVMPGGNMSDLVYVATTPQALAKHIETWAEQQVVGGLVEQKEGKK